MPCVARATFVLVGKAPAEDPVRHPGGWVQPGDRRPGSVEAAIRKRLPDKIIEDIIAMQRAHHRLGVGA
ncbi:hypothetical protein [Pseudomonas aeruginosa]|uniref:hypothetical protein n=1 Tax=Pseudomonas aeruginosa TaxID=287 RepID=UPI003D6DEA25